MDALEKLTGAKAGRPWWLVHPIITGATYNSMDWMKGKSSPETIDKDPYEDHGSSGFTLSLKAIHCMTYNL